ncbi:MAG: hypothetical protein AB8B92_06435 [Gammaproteobacteria bacterium]
MNKCWSSNFINILLLALLPIYIIVHATLLPLSISGAGIADAGYVSIITLTFIGCAILTLLILIFNTDLDAPKLTAATSAYVLFIYLLREADVHRLFTVEHVTRGKFYLMPEVPLWQKVFAAAIFLVLIVCILYLLIKYLRGMRQKLLNLEPHIVALFLWFTVLVISQLCDRSDLNHTHLGRVIEECCECWAAMFLFLATVQSIPSLKLHRK